MKSFVPSPFTDIPAVDVACRRGLSAWRVAGGRSSFKADGRRALDAGQARVGRITHVSGRMGCRNSHL